MENQLLKRYLSHLTIWILFFEIGNPLVKLTIIARAEYNGTKVKCVVNGGLSGRSESASLTIQGGGIVTFVFLVL